GIAILNIGTRLSIRERQPPVRCLLWAWRMVMSETRTSQWQEICLQAMLEVEPNRRIAILEKLGRILRKNNHEYGPLWVDFGHAEVKRNGSPVYLKNLELRLLRYLIERIGSCVSRDEL